jgi:hypothetical protein
LKTILDGPDDKIKGTMEVALGPIQEDLVYDFLRGLKNINEVEVRVVLRG